MDMAKMAAACLTLHLLIGAGLSNAKIVNLYRRSDQFFCPPGPSNKCFHYVEFDPAPYPEANQKCKDYYPGSRLADLPDCSKDMGQPICEFAASILPFDMEFWTAQAGDECYAISQRMDFAGGDRDGAVYQIAPQQCDWYIDVLCEMDRANVDEGGAGSGGGGSGGGDYGGGWPGEGGDYGGGDYGGGGGSVEPTPSTSPSSSKQPTTPSYSSSPSASKPSSAPSLPSLPPLTTTKRPTVKQTIKYGISNVKNIRVCGRSLGGGAGRIVGGKKSKKYQWPWIVRLLIKGSQGCGGSILNEHWILSAAHCFSPRAASGKKGLNSDKPEDWVVVAGELGVDAASEKSNKQRSKHKVEQIIWNPDFNGTTYENDVALLRLKDPIKIDPRDGKIGVICLTDVLDLFKPGTKCTVAGWGLLGEMDGLAKTLMHVELSMLSQKECHQMWKENAYGQPYDSFAAAKTLSNAYLCTYSKATEGAKDACQGDSGGPLMCRTNRGQYVQVGVVSNGYGCANEGYPAMFARVSSYYSWIKNTVEGPRRRRRRR